MSPARAAGLLLLLTAAATAVSVATRLAGSQEPAADSPLYAPVILDTTLYTTAAVARVVSGLALMGAAGLFRQHCQQMGMASGGALVAALFSISGIVTAASGLGMVALAGALPEYDSPRLAQAAAGDYFGWVEPLNAVRSITGKAGFTLAGLGLIALAGAALVSGQWRAGGRLVKAGAIASLVIGIAMLFIWVDAATVMHRVSGIAFLVWLIGAGIGLTARRVSAPALAAAE